MSDRTCVLIVFLQAGLVSGATIISLRFILKWLFERFAKTIDATVESTLNKKLELFKKSLDAELHDAIEKYNTASRLLELGREVAYSAVKYMRELAPDFEDVCDEEELQDRLRPNMDQLLERYQELEKYIKLYGDHLSTELLNMFKQLQDNFRCLMYDGSTSNVLLVEDIDTEGEDLLRAISNEVKQLKTRLKSES